MDQIHLINTVRIWQRQLEIEREKKENARKSSYTDSLAELERLREPRGPISERWSKRKGDRRPAGRAYPQENCLESPEGC